MVKYVLIIVASILVGIILDRRICNRAFDAIKSDYYKYLSFFSVLEQWLSNKQNNINIEEYLIRQGYQKIAIYGMSVLGNLLYQELKETKVEVSYAIDRNADNMHFELPVLKPSDEYGKVDVIIVTAVLDYEKIKKNIIKKTQVNVMSIEDLVFETAE